MGSAIAGALTCRTQPDRDVVRLVLEGRLDLRGAEVVQEQLDDLRLAGFEHLVLDLDGVDDADLAGLRALASWRRLAADEGWRLDVEGHVGRHSRVARRLAGVRGVMRLREVPPA